MSFLFYEASHRETSEMKWKWTKDALWLALGACLTALLVGSCRAGSCPGVCACKWKGGKQTVECLERALITIPDDVDSETQVLDVSENNLQIIPRETFYKANLTNLQKLYLKGCRIGQIGDRAFRGLTNLVELDLSRNLLTAVPSAAFDDTPFLRYLSLADNPIQKIEANAFGTASGIAKIDLSHCEIQTVSPNAFEKLDSLEWLKLNANKLTYLHPGTVETMGKLHGVELHDNPWTCDCKLRATKEWLSRSNVPCPVAPACKSPERVAGRTFAELGVDDFACRPEILPASRYVEATTGENATVSCRVGAVPPANVHWYWNGRLLLNNSAFTAYQRIFIIETGKFEKTSSLILTNALETDSGEFYCVAENRAGTGEANFTLHVSFRTAGMSSLGSGQIAGLSAALVVLILAILMIALILLLRLRRLPFSESKTPGRLEVIATTNGDGVTTTAAKPSRRAISDHEDRKHSQVPNPVRKPPRTSDSFAGVGCDTHDASHEHSSKSPANNPDIIRDAKPDGRAPSVNWNAIAVGLPPEADAYARDRPHDSTTWDFDSVPDDSFPRCTSDRGALDASDQTPIISEGNDEHRSFSRANLNEYPPDYGLPILDQPFRNPWTGGESSSPGLPDAKTVRVWQRGVPVLPPVTAFKRVLATSRNSPDEGYQEGCGTDV